jgi:hypothetical protein
VANAQTVTTAPETPQAAARRYNRATLCAATWLSLAATPTFAVMALHTGVIGAHAMDMGMATMYLLMSIFHSTHWLKLVSRREGGLHRSGSDFEARVNQKEGD